MIYVLTVLDPNMTLKSIGILVSHCHNNINTGVFSRAI